MKVIYVTNACGEETGHAGVTNAELEKIPFEDGPGVILTYIADVEGIRCLLGVLELAYDDSFWGDSSDLSPQSVVKAEVERLLPGMLRRIPSAGMVWIDDDEPARYSVYAAVPLDLIEKPEDVMHVLSWTFGTYAAG